MFSFHVFQKIFQLKTCEKCYKIEGRVKYLQMINPFVPTVAFSQLSSNMCCPRDCISRHNGGTRGAPIMPAHVGSTCWNGGNKWVNVFGFLYDVLFVNKYTLKVQGFDLGLKNCSKSVPLKSVRPIQFSVRTTACFPARFQAFFPACCPPCFALITACFQACFPVITCCSS